MPMTQTYGTLTINDPYIHVDLVEGGYTEWSTLLLSTTMPSVLITLMSKAKCMHTAHCILCQLPGCLHQNWSV